jgi:hypothetical protein
MILLKNGGLHVERWNGQRNLSLGRNTGLGPILEVVDYNEFFWLRTVRVVKMCFFLIWLLCFLTTLSTCTDLTSMPRPYFLGKKDRVKKRGHLADLRIGGRTNNTNRDCKKGRSEDAHLIQPAPGTVQWPAVVNTVMNIRSPQKTGNVLII